MIHKWLREGMSKSSIARRLGISRETVRKYALKPEGYVPVISRKPNENLVDEPTAQPPNLNNFNF
ncbi:helix-turn-helix domain-containing protein [Aliarcobacter cryaerophilus]|uniref:helix-turn-helix domain-containing protein n=1 Tax=Aliarcobacter cryaerophilus TaxID=28198 RepID=UPI0036F3FD33